MMNDNSKIFRVLGVLIIGFSISLINSSLDLISYGEGFSDFFSYSLFLLIGIACLLMGIKIIFDSIYRDRKLQKLPELVSSAKLVSKGTEIRGRHTITIYYLTFELPDNSRKTFKVSSDMYNSVLKNETGVLTYKEQDKLIQFLDFKRNIP